MNLIENKFPGRKADLEFRVFNDGVAFRTEFPKQFGDWEKETTVKKGDSVKIKMVPGGGFAAWLEPIK